MGDTRIVLTENRDDLAEAGITCFGHYSQKNVEGRLDPEHHGSSYEICYLESGVQPYYIAPEGDTDMSRARLYELRGGEIFISRPYQMHSTGPYFQQRGSLYWIQLDSQCPRLLFQTERCVSALQQALSSIDKHLIPAPAPMTSRMTEAFHLLTREGEENTLRAMSLLTLFAFELAQAVREAPDYVEKDSHSSAGKEAMTFIRDNLLAPGLNLAAIAKHLHYSEAYTSTLFRRETGLTIHEFIMRCKIDYACVLLEKYSITDVAALLNFSSAQHFSKVFREQMGVTPSRYAGAISAKKAGIVPMQSYE